MQIKMWHGGRKWDGAPEIRPSKRGSAELGPGIYVSNFLERAVEYAKGGGCIREIVFSPRLILEQTALSLSDACDFVTSVIVKSKQGGVIEKMIECAGRHSLEGRLLLGTDKQHLHAESLVNLCVNGDLALGAKGQALAEFLVAQGVDCAFTHRSGNEFWGTIYNPKCIDSYEKRLASTVDLSQKELPSPLAQLEIQRVKSSRIILPHEQSPAF
ncbi:hypothetical protein [Pseudomonas amygdali]|uniref:DUF3990 domain-containing protein n=1 Tax=Pseudomonas amygdali pv. lachrymans str. M301315 TaxID=629260 RepID=A0AAD0PWZ0_PSEAV|nr:hypothetical protein [Pseudomonas amygdali]AXH60256.1 hypothetical protein PLA107_034280 [Pseudomonas amygdali pv. lachrymans str. M301315]RMT06246.1 hypothetical protein ALP54_04082 [Pseudomonas amygdali pv. lachrymans]